LETTEGLNNS